MSGRRINWLKVGANAGVAFFSVLAGTLTVNAICDAKVPLGLLILAAVFSGLIQAGLAFCKELAKAAGGRGGPTADRRNPGDTIRDSQTNAGHVPGDGNPGRHEAAGVCEDLVERERAWRRCMRRKKAFLVLTLMTVF